MSDVMTGKVDQLLASTTNCGQMKLILNVIDVNDHSPQFTSNEPYRFMVDENAPIGHHIGKVHSIDLDSGINGQIKYSILTQQKQLDSNQFETVETQTGNKK
jgi:hypothetical protein